MLELGPDDYVVAMRGAGEVLAVGVGRRARYDARVSRKIPEDQAYVLLLRDGSEVARTQPERGVLRGIVPTRSGFVVLRVAYSNVTGTVEAQVSTLSHDGKQRSLPTLAADVIGVFGDAEDNVYAYSSRQVMVHPRSDGGWREVDAFTGWKEPISRIVALDGGPIAVAGARSVAGFGRVGEAPVFRKDFGPSDQPMELRGAGGSWWVILPGEGEQKVMQVDQQGVVRASVTMRDVLVDEVHPWNGKIILVCSGKGRAVHKSFFYEWHAGGDGALWGPFDLPDDITKSSVARQRGTWAKDLQQAVGVNRQAVNVPAIRSDRVSDKHSVPGPGTGRHSAAEAIGLQRRSHQERLQGDPGKVEDSRYVPLASCRS